jgi:D-beta-D-heptose 7-phosphate kinase/D-beta-D-heptose 1-phosphate adenosyltransferase
MTASPPSSPLSRDRLAELTDRAQGRRIVVIGDVMLDRYLIGDTDRLSPEAPVPVVTVRETRLALGGAGNVAANVLALGALPILVGTVGDDTHGQALRAELAAQRIDDRGLLTVAGRPTTTKTRVIARSQQIVRLDEEVEDRLEAVDQARLTEAALHELDRADGVLLEDYNKGTLAPDLIRAVIDRARQRGIPVVADPKFRNFFEYAGVTVFKPNRRELDAALGAAVDLAHPEALPAALATLRVDNLLLTLGAEGMVLVTKDLAIIRVPSLARSVYDVSGAGDTVTAWVGAMLSAGAAVWEAAMIANYAAGIEVTKHGVATVLPDEVLRAHDAYHDQIGRLRRGGAI